MKKIVLNRIFGLLAGLSIIVVLFITSIEIAAYGDFHWYEKEYEKYDVLLELPMEMDDVMNVTEEMMSYLRGDREDLVVHTTVDGTQREFFNDREKAHMEDVRRLFLGGLKLRWCALLVCSISSVLIIRENQNYKRSLATSFLVCVACVIGITGFLGGLIATDFTKYFTIFHEIFFDNDLWLLDPRTDLMIRMLPEGFFSDMVIRIVTIFGIEMGTMIVGSVIALKKRTDKKVL